MNLWNNKEHRNIFDDAEDLAHASECGSWTSWMLGLAVPISIFFYAVWSMASGTITLPGRNESLTITGPDVPILGAAYISLAVFLHLHFVWSAHPKWWEYAHRLKVVTLLIFLPCLLTVLYHQLGF